MSKKWWRHRRQRWHTVSTFEFLSTIRAKVYPDPDHIFRNTRPDRNLWPLQRLLFKGQRVSTRISFSRPPPSPIPEWWTRTDLATTQRPLSIKISSSSKTVVRYCVYCVEGNCLQMIQHLPSFYLFLVIIPKRMHYPHCVAFSWYNVGKLNQGKYLGNAMQCRNACVNGMRKREFICYFFV